MKRTGRSILSLALCLFLLAGMLPFEALANENGVGGLDLSEVKEIKTYNCGSGTATWEYSGNAGDEGGTPHKLTLNGTGTITATDGKPGITFPGDAVKMTVSGDWTITGGEGASGIYQYRKLDLILTESAKLKATGGKSKGDGQDEHGISAQQLSITVNAGGELQAYAGEGTEGVGQGYSGCGLNGFLKTFPIVIVNNGTITAVSDGEKPQYGIGCTGGVTLSGTGVTYVSGGTGICVQKMSFWGTDSKVGVAINGGTLVALGSTHYGIQTEGTNGESSVTIASDANGLAAGKLLGMESSETITNGSMAFLALDQTVLSDFPLVNSSDYSTGLNLKDVTSTTLFTSVGRGAGLWEYSLVNDCRTYHRLTLTNGHITSGGLSLPAGDVELDLKGDNTVAGGVSMPEDQSTSNRLALSGSSSLAVTSDSGKPFTGVTGVGIVEPQTGYYATAVAGADSGSARGIPGSVFTNKGGGTYYPQDADQYFKLDYQPTTSLTTGQYLLTVENGFGGGVYSATAQVPVSFDSALYDPSATGRWEDMGDPTQTYGTAKNFTLTMPAGNLGLIYNLEYRPPTPGPSLETGEHDSYLHGYGDGTIRPEKNLTREETAQLFYNLMDEDSRALYESTDCPFPDVRKGSWSYKAVCTLAKAGVLNGYEDGTFRPGGMVTRAEFAAIAARSDPGTYEGEDLFPDIAGHWARGYINYAGSRGWVNGYEDGTYRPESFITRAEAAALINRVLERHPETVDDLLPGRKVFTDNADPGKWYYLDMEEAANSHEYRRKSFTGPAESWTALK